MIHLNTVLQVVVIVLRRTSPINVSTIVVMIVLVKSMLKHLLSALLNVANVIQISINFVQKLVVFVMTLK